MKKLFRKKVAHELFMGHFFLLLAKIGHAKQGILLICLSLSSRPVNRSSVYLIILHLSA